MVKYPLNPLTITRNTMETPSLQTPPLFFCPKIYIFGVSCFCTPVQKCLHSTPNGDSLFPPSEAGHLFQYFLRALPEYMSSNSHFSLYITYTYTSTGYFFFCALTRILFLVRPPTRQCEVQVEIPSQALWSQSFCVRTIRSASLHTTLYEFLSEKKK